MKKKLIDLFWKFKACYITTFACVLAIINLFLKTHSLLIEVWIVLSIGNIKLFLDMGHSNSKLYEDLENAYYSQLKWMELPVRINNAVNVLELDDVTRAKVIDAIWEETAKIQRVSEGLIDDD